MYICIYVYMYMRVCIYIYIYIYDTGLKCVPAALPPGIPSDPEASAHSLVCGSRVRSRPSIRRRVGSSGPSDVDGGNGTCVDRLPASPAGVGAIFYSTLLYYILPASPASILLYSTILYYTLLDSIILYYTLLNSRGSGSDLSGCRLKWVLAAQEGPPRGRAEGRGAGGRGRPLLSLVLLLLLLSIILLMKL